AATGCGGGSVRSNARSPATVTRVAGSDRYCITLSPESAQRLRVRTAPVRRTAGGSVIPYSAVLYSPTGAAWACVRVKPLTFVRARIVVDRVQGNHVALRDGPAPGTLVVTAGVPELHGIEYQADAAGSSGDTGGTALATASTSSCTP